MARDTRAYFMQIDGWWDEDNWSSGTKYEQMKEEEIEMYGIPYGTMYIPFVGECVLPNNVTREGLFRLVDPVVRNALRGHVGELDLRACWEETVEEGGHNLQFEDWVDHHSLWLNDLKIQSTTPCQGS